MIDLYFGPTSNGRKIAIMLEETALPYTLHRIDILSGDQFKPDYLKLNPNNKMPTIVDRDGPDGAPIVVFESGAILIYLARKAGMFLPKHPRREMMCMQWLMWQMAGVGPMFGQWVHFSMYAPDKIPYAIERYRREVDRLRLVANGHLAAREYFADEYSIADIAVFPWVYSFRTRLPSEVATPHLDAWTDRVAARPAVMRGYKLMMDEVHPVAAGKAPVTKEIWNVLYGTVQHGERFRGNPGASAPG